MKKLILCAAGLLMIAHWSKAQLYSSGNNIIAGTSVGIGISTPSSGTRLHIANPGIGELLRLQNTTPTGIGRFTFYNDVVTNYATFTKYGSTYPGGYAGVATQYPYANLFAFGNNGGPSLYIASGNVGIGISKAGNSRIKFNINYTTEYVGIGGNALPAANVHFNHDVSGDTIKITNSTTGHTATDGLDIRLSGNASTIMNLENSSLSFGTNNLSRMTINPTGTVVIGTTTTPSGYKLYVEQGILTEKVKVALKTSANWADFVFHDDYKLQPLPEVEAYIKTHKHLPGIPSADQVVQEGLDLAVMDAKLLQKIEELTLHMIRLEKEMAALKETNARLQSQIDRK
ncbi:MAG: hypothetical protein JNJ58_04610 [Chitinophagaceae bacterium]|nr:hypothetical protein [Chitinophagaceae bacterium]